jgi:multiple sugar transport system permease protein
MNREKVVFSFFMIMALTLKEVVRMRKIVRAMFLLPWVAPSSLTVLAWVWMFDSQYSIVTYFLQQMGLVEGKIPWFGDPELAMFAVQMVNIWRGVPFFGMLILAGLVTVPQELYEAATMDGANSWQRFWSVTFPHILPILLVATLFSFVITLGDFQIVWIRRSKSTGRLHQFVGIQGSRLLVDKHVAFEAVDTVDHVAERIVSEAGTVTDANDPSP